MSTLAERGPDVARGLTQVHTGVQARWGLGVVHGMRNLQQVACMTGGDACAAALREAAAAGAWHGCVPPPLLTCTSSSNAAARVCLLRSLMHKMISPTMPVTT